jgi:NTP pyrophosphatase (non-canonical NTP hydrolase)
MITHPELVEKLAKPGADILKELTPEDCELWHMASCICSEAGELFDAIKKLVIYRKPLDRANVVEELGDLEFYMEGARQVLAITRQETLDANILKLSKRYNELKYSNKSAVKRADKELVDDGLEPSSYSRKPMGGRGGGNDDEAE